MDNKKILAQNLKELMRKKGVTRNKLSEDLGFPYMTVSDWINGKTYPRINRIEALAKYFNVSMYELIEESANEKNIILDVYNRLIPPRQDNVYTYAVHQLEEQNIDEATGIYIVGQTAAGEPLSYGDSNINKINTHIPKGADYALTVKGDSMEPLIKNGSIIFYKEQPTLENGEVGIIEVNREEVTCKKFYRYDDKVVLRSINEKYEDITLKDVPVRVIGKVIL